MISRISLPVLFLIASAAALPAQTAPDTWWVARILDVSPVTATTTAGFELFTQADRQSVVFQGKLAERTLDSGTWTIKPLTASTRLDKAAATPRNNVRYELRIERGMLRVYELRPPEYTLRVHGDLSADARAYKPLDSVVVRVTGRQKGDQTCRIRVADPEQRTYLDQEVALKNNKGELRFHASGALGVHYIYLTWPGERTYSRYLNFRLDADTSIESGDRDFDTLYPTTRAAMGNSRREYNTPRGKFVGYISADTNHFDGIWLRDWIYQLPAYKYWERDMSCGIDRFLEVQGKDGQVPDGIERSGKTWRVGLESDVEYIMTLGVWQTWQVTGDDKWLAAGPAASRKCAEVHHERSQTLGPRKSPHQTPAQLRHLGL